VFRVSADLHWVNDKRNYFAPSDWKKLDENDEDLGGTNPIPLDVPAPNGSTQALILALGKDRNAYLLDRNDLGVKKVDTSTEGGRWEGDLIICRRDHFGHAGGVRSGRTGAAQVHHLR